jgi:hypothetical protein
MTDKDMRAREILETLKFKEEREKIEAMSLEEYRTFLEEKLGNTEWARKEIDLLVRAKIDGAEFKKGYSEANNIESKEPIDRDIRAYIRESREVDSDE